jgi:ferritin-like metal-binding protein YciE
VKIQSFFNLGLTFAATGDQLAVTGFNQYPADDRAWTQDGIRQNKAEIMAEVRRMQDRLTELIRQADNSKGMTPDAVAGISAEGSEIIKHLSPEKVQEIFKESIKK